MNNSLPITIFFFPLLISSSIFQSTRASDSEPSSKDFIGGEINRRILHQPLFPDTSTPSSPPPPPPPPPDTSEEDQPFFHELPTGPSLDQGQQTLPPPSAGGAAAANPVITPPENSSISHGQSIKKIAIAISSGVLTLGMLSVMAFFLYKHRAKHLGESQKLVGRNSERNNEASNMPPSTFLYIGTVEPSTATMVNESNGNGYGATRSPYRKLRTQRYRPSPELQPLPPLTKPPPPPRVNSPPPLSSSDDESHDTNFYTPNGTSRSNESSSSRQSYSRNNMSVPHSKRTSPKSRFSSSSPDAKPVMIPSIKQSPPDSSLGPLQPSKTLSYIQKRPKFSAPPPPPDTARLRLITGGENKETSQITCLPPHATRPPPPPPPPPLSMSRNHEEMEKCIPSLVSKPVILQQSKSPKISSEKADPEEKDGSKRRLKPLHWDKVRATSEQATVWDQLKSSSFQLNEDAMDSLFGCNSANSVPKEVTRKSAVPCSEHENRVLDPKKSQNIAILLRALNVTRDEVSEALLDGNPEGLGADLLETLVKMAPTKEEEIKLKDYNGESSKLGSAERFLKEILDIPFAFKRVDAMLYRANFDTEVKYLRTSFQALEKASEELKSSRLFLKLLEAVLRVGNRMNDGTNRGEARAFKLDTLLKLVDIKGTDGKTTLLHFVVQEIIRSEGENPDPNKTNSKLFKEEEFKKHGLQVLSGLSKELGNVKKAAGMDSDVLSSYVSKLETGLQKVRLVLQYEIQGVKGKFFGSMKDFLTEAVEEISKVKAEERKALSLVKEVTQYFHADAAKDEARQFRIFVIVRDFLSILENVCKDVGRMQDRATMGAGRSFRIPATASLPVLTRYNMPHEGRYDDDDST